MGRGRVCVSQDNNFKEGIYINLNFQRVGGVIKTKNFCEMAISIHYPGHCIEKYICSGVCFDQSTSNPASSGGDCPW